MGKNNKTDDRRSTALPEKKKREQKMENFSISLHFAHGSNYAAVSQMFGK